MRKLFFAYAILALTPNISPVISAQHIDKGTLALFTGSNRVPKCIYCAPGTVDPFDPCPSIPINPPCSK